MFPVRLLTTRGRHFVRPWSDCSGPNRTLPSTTPLGSTGSYQRAALRSPLQRPVRILRFAHIPARLFTFSFSSSSLVCPVIWGRRYSCLILFLHSALFVALSTFSPASVISLLHASFHLRFGRPLRLFPGMSTYSILLTMCSSFILLTWPYHFSRFSVIFLDACTTLHVISGH